MKLIINERQYRLLIENENGINPDGELFEMSDIVSPFKWDKTFLRACKLEPGKYRGYYINGNVDLSKSQIKELKYLVKVEGYLYLRNTSITELPLLSTVGGYLDLYNTPIKSLPMLKTVGGDVYLKDTQITELPLLTTVRSDLNLNYTPIKSLPMLSTVEGDLYLRGTPLEKELKKTMSDKEIKNKFGVEGNLYI